MGVTIEQLRAQFAEIAKALSQPAAMVTATTAQAKLAGLWVERSEQTRKQLDEMSDAEIAAILRGIEDLHFQTTRSAEKRFWLSGLAGVHGQLFSLSTRFLMFSLAFPPPC